MEEVQGILSRFIELGKFTPEMTLQVLGMVIDGTGTMTEWSGEELDRFGEMIQELADKIKGVKEQRQP